jgi:hypothetical protein
MTLIAATAAGFALARWMYYEHYLSNYQRNLNEEPMPGKLVLGLQYLVQVTSPVVVVVTLAILDLVLARRPSVGDLMCQPGPATCLTVSFFLALAFGVRIACCRLTWMHKFGIGSNYNDASDVIRSALWETFRNAPPGVIVCWVTLALAGHWKPQPNWLDRLGRIVGSYWVFLNLMPR